MPLEIYAANLPEAHNLLNSPDVIIYVIPLSDSELIYYVPNYAGGID